MTKLLISPPPMSFSCNNVAQIGKPSVYADSWAGLNYMSGVGRLDITNIEFAQLLSQGWIPYMLLLEVKHTVD